MVDDLDDPAEVHVESYFNVIDAFEMPAQRYDPVRNAFAM
jgi:DNA polymerase epsilon subunit 2